MSKRILWVAVSGLMALTLFMAACGQAQVEEQKPSPAPATPAAPVTPAAPTAPSVPAEKEAVKPSPEAPKYGGTVNLIQTTEPLHFDGAHHVGQNSNGTALVNTSLWIGDWAKGLAGGYGSGENDWREQSDIWEQKVGNIADSWKWGFDDKKGEGTVVYQIRQGLHWGLDPKNPDSRMVGGRGITADDIVFNLKRANTDTLAYTYGNPDLRETEITKTGPWEVTVRTTKLEALISIVTRFSGMPIYAPEVIKKYGNARNWKNSVSSGPFFLTDYVPGSVITFASNPNFWGKDPIGPGKGNQLPYLDGVKMLVITDASTRLAALRTAKLDWMSGVTWEEAADLRKTAPRLLDSPWGRPGTGPVYIFMNTTKPPFNDVRVRRAMSMAIDMQTLHKTMNGGTGQLLTWPHGKHPGYEALYLGLDDPEMPESVKELYVYNPEKSKQLLKEAGYPNGFKTAALITSTDVDSFSIYKDYFAKVGIDMELDVRDNAAKTAIVRSWEHPAITTAGHNPIGIWYMASDFWGRTQVNGSMVDDPIINKAVAEIRATLIKEGSAPAMAQWKEMMKYLLDQAYVINAPRGQPSLFYWPWIKNYSGEQSVGYYIHPNWVQWVWYDQDLKKKMGY